MLLLPLFAGAQNRTLISDNDSIPSILERIVQNQNASDEKLKNIRHIKSHINLEFASSANAYFTAGEFDELSFKMNRVRLEIYGRLTDRLSYHFRQSFNRYSNPYSVENMSSSIEYANLKWTVSDRFDLVAGKQFLATAGYEGYVNGLKVREFSEFNNNFEIFQTGLKVLTTTCISMVFQQESNRRSFLFLQQPTGQDGLRIRLSLSCTLLQPVSLQKERTSII